MQHEDWSRPLDVSLSADSAPGGRVLYFDANPRTAKLTAAGLSLAGYGVDIVATGEAAEAALEAAAHGSRPFSVVIVDACAPGEDAEKIVDLVESEPKLGKGFPLIILTSRAKPEPFSAATRHACLKRPFATPSLVSLLRHMVGEPELRIDPEASEVSGSARVRTVGGYDLIAEIARGGMGTVYLCRKRAELGFHRLYAMKILHPHLAEQEAFVTMLVDEARLASRLHHPNVAAVVDLGHGDLGPFIVMEYVEGPSLSQLLKLSTKARPTDLLLPVFAEILEGLHAAHELEDSAGQSLNLVHRDVSPQNILLGVDGRARLADFGVAKARARLGVTRDGVVKGKLAYVAPELLMDDEICDSRADIFATGAVMWSVLTGRALFVGQSEAKTIRNILEMKVPPPSTVGLKPPACLDAIILKALERDPNARFQTAQEMADELRNLGRQHDLFAAPSKVAAWVRKLFGDRLVERRNAIRLAKTALVVPESPSRVSETDVIAMSLSVEDVETKVDTLEDHPPVREERQRRAWLPLSLAGLLAVGSGIAVVTSQSDSAPTQARLPNPPDPVPVAASAPTTPQPPPDQSRPADPVPVESPEPVEPEPGIDATAAAEAVAATPDPPAAPRRRPKPRTKPKPKPKSPAAESPSKPKATPPTIEKNPYR